MEKVWETTNEKELQEHRLRLRTYFSQIPGPEDKKETQDKITQPISDPPGVMGEGCRLTRNSQGFLLLSGTQERDQKLDSEEKDSEQIVLLPRDCLLLDFESEKESSVSTSSVSIFHAVSYSRATSSYSYWRWSVAEKERGRSPECGLDQDAENEKMTTPVRISHLDVGRQDRLSLMKDLRGKVWLATLKNDSDSGESAVYLMDPAKNFGQKEKIALPASGPRQKLSFSKEEGETKIHFTCYDQEGNLCRYRRWRGEWEKV